MSDDDHDPIDSATRLLGIILLMLIAAMLAIIVIAVLVSSSVTINFTN